MAWRRRFVALLFVVLLLGLGSWLTVRFLLLPAGESATVQLSPGDGAGVELWLRLVVTPFGATTFDVIDLDIPRQREDALTICYDRLGFSQETWFPFDEPPPDHFAPPTPALGYERRYFHVVATGAQGQSVNYHLVNVCNTVNPVISTYDTARILTPEVAADVEMRRLLVALARARYFYPFDRLEIPLTAGIGGTVQDSQPLLSTGSKPALFAVVQAPEWRVGVEPDTVVLTRSLGEQLLTLVVLALAAAFVVALWFVRSETEMMGAALGILLGLTGVRDALVPDFVTWTTVVDRFIVLLYVLLAGVVGAWVVKRRLRRGPVIQ